ncbi:MAG TPA: ABC transporter permease [Acidobacteriota bacterium]|nr:ABC transporter permease [Acidobacteriota bacterium]
MRGFWEHLRSAWRTLLRSPGFTFLIIFTLALGIGANTAIFSALWGIVLSPLPYPNQDRLAALCQTHSEQMQGYCGFSPADMVDVRERAQRLESVGLGRGWHFTLKRGDQATGLSGGLADSGLFQVFGARPLLGRLFQPQDLKEANNHVVILSHALWQSEFGARREILGEEIELDGEPYTVVGVLEAGFEIPNLDWVRLWKPLHFDPSLGERRNWRGFRPYGRLAEGVSWQSAEEEMQALAAQLALDYPEVNEGFGATIIPLRRFLVGQSLRSQLGFFMAAVAVVLLIGCLNVANLLLARGVRRRREWAIRSALGAGRFRLILRQLGESLLLGLAGGLLGVLLAYGLLPLILQLAPSNIPRLEEVSINPQVLVFALLLSLATSLLFGIIPALRSSRLDLVAALKEGRAYSQGRRGGRLSSGLVSAEMALALLMMAGALMLVKTYLVLQDWQPGFDHHNLLTVQIFPPDYRYPDADALAEFYPRLVEEVQALPGVESAGLASAGPLFGGLDTTTVYVAGRPVPSPQEMPEVRFYDIDPNYFATLRRPLLAGRGITSEDRRGAPPVAVINETFAKRFFANQSPLGARLILPERDNLALEVVGMVSDVKPFLPNTPPESKIFWSLSQFLRGATHVVVRQDPSSAHGDLTKALTDRLKSVESDLSVSTVHPLSAAIQRELAPTRFHMTLLGSFAFLAAALAAVGIFGVISHAVSSRRHEMGVRQALGADRMRIAATVLALAGPPTALGMALGLAAFVPLSGALQAFVFGLETVQPPLLALALLLASLIAAAAVLMPIYRATRVHPSEALRQE